MESVGRIGFRTDCAECKVRCGSYTHCAAAVGAVEIAQ